MYDLISSLNVHIVQDLYVLVRGHLLVLGILALVHILEIRQATKLSLTFMTEHAIMWP